MENPIKMDDLGGKTPLFSGSGLFAFFGWLDFFHLLLCKSYLTNSS